MMSIPKSKTYSTTDSTTKTKKRSSGQQSVIMTNEEVVQRSSIIKSALLWDIEDVQKLELLHLFEKGIAHEKEYFFKAIQRESNESKYVVKKKIKSGGMGEVYYVYDRDFRRYSAMKVILPELKQDSHAIRSFMTEARITGQLEHPNIIPVHDLGFLPGRGIYFTMKMMKGEPLNRILQKIELGDQEYVKKYDIFMLLSIFRKVCDAVAYAHSKQVLHRDIKPHNIMVGEYGEVLLMDWGLAKKMNASFEEEESFSDLPEEQQEDMSVGKGKGMTTELGVVKGSPAFMSPEQALGDVVSMDERSDIFLLGATLYHMFTFYPPYLGDDVYEIVTQARNHELIPPEELGTGRYDIPYDLSRIMMKCLSKEKEDRYSRLEEVMEEVDAFLRGDINFSQRTFQKGDILMREGDVGAESYLISRGKVQVEKNVHGKNVTISTLGADAIVGELSIITSEPRSATVVALEETEVMILDEELFQEYLKRLPGWLSKTFVTLAQRLTTSTTRNIE